MNTFNNLKFLKFLIDSDFAFFNKKLISINNNLYLNFNLKLKKNLELNYLNLFELNKNIKHLLRILQFLEKSSNKDIHIWVEDKFMYYLLTSLLVAFPINNCKIIISTKRSCYLDSLNKLSLLLIIGNPRIIQNNTIYKKLLNNNNIFIYKINTKIEKYTFNTYKMYNDVYDIKKVIVFFILLNKFLTLKIK